jgi:micrococcal nuclease
VRSLIALTALSILLLSSYTGPGCSLGTGTTTAGEASVIDVVDGDTIQVLLRGKVYRVRYIGIDTPEMDDPRPDIRALAGEATLANKSLVEGNVVELEKDVSEIDRYGRLLRYVYVEELLVNAELVRLGYAWAVAYPPDLKYQALLFQLQEEAQEMGRGLWADGAVP